MSTFEKLSYLNQRYGVVEIKAYETDHADGRLAFVECRVPNDPGAVYSGDTSWASWSPAHDRSPETSVDFVVGMAYDALN